jgi:A/G-specific adenine glycosylase
VLPRDVNVARVLRRRFPDGVDITADPWHAGQALMEFGQRICRARPDCGHCPVVVGCIGPDPAAEERARPRRQARFEGSLRQRRGRLLARVIAEGTVPRAEADPDAADGLVLDELIVADGELLRAPR